MAVGQPVFATALQGAKAPNDGNFAGIVQGSITDNIS